MGIIPEYIWKGPTSYIHALRNLQDKTGYKATNFCTRHSIQMLVTCKKKYQTKFALFKHLKIGAGFCPLQCIFCTKTFANKVKLVKQDKLW